MANIAPTQSYVTPNDGSVVLVNWGAVTEADTFAAISLPNLTDMMMQVSGTFGGAAVALHGSLDGVSFFPLVDLAGTPISLTAAGLAKIAPGPVNYIRPVATGGASQSLTVLLLACGQSLYRR